MTNPTTDIASKRTPGPREPRTAAGRSLLIEEGPICEEWTENDWRGVILAIEDEAANTYDELLAVALKKAVEALPGQTFGHMDSGWNDAIGAYQTWHECIGVGGVSRAAVLALIESRSVSTSREAGLDAILRAWLDGPADDMTEADMKFADAAEEWLAATSPASPAEHTGDEGG